jgi:predicted permease
MRRYLRPGRGRANIQRQVDEELTFHLDACVDELVAQGLAPQAARLEAQRRLGDLAAMRARLMAIDEERLARERRADWWNGVAQDARYAARGLRRSLGFTAGVVVTLALGIGANAAVFTVIDRLLLRPPPHVADAKSLRRVHVEMTFRDGRKNTRGPMSYAEFMALRDGVRSFDRIAAFSYPVSVALGSGVDAPRIKRSGASADFFRVLGVRPEVGRFFVAEDDDAAVSRPAAVLGYGIWQRRFGGEADVIGEPVVLDGRPYVIVGVAPKGFSGADVDAPDVWLPLAPVLAADGGPKWKDNKLGFGLHVIARLRPGISAEQAAAEAALAVRPAYEGIFMAELPATVRLGSVIPGRRLDRTDSGISVATRLVGAAAMVLLIACANVANLLLARALARRRELAVRLALGVGRGRLMTQLLTESLLLASIAGGGALLVAVWGGALLRGLLLPDVSWASPPVDGRVLAFTVAIAVACGILAGLAPAMQMTRHDLIGSLKAGWRDTSRGGSAARSGLVLLQAAFTVILLVGAGLFVRSLHNARTLDVGFAIDRTILADVRFSRGTVPSPRIDPVYDALAARVRRVPGVAGVSVTSTAPYWTISFERVWIPGLDSLPADLTAPPIHAVDPRFLSTMGIELTAGREITVDDRAGAPNVALVNATMARRAWAGVSPLGRCLKIGADTAPCTTVVGVVGDVGFMNLREAPPPQYYVPIAQTPALGNRNRYLVVRVADGTTDVRDVAAAVRSGLRGAHPGIEALDVRPMADLLDPEIRSFRLGAMMFGVFGILALLLAGVGLYAVIAFAVTRRTRELGIRTALGARATDVARLVLGEGIRVTLAGVALGLALSLALGRVVEALLFGASPRDPLVFAVVSFTLVAVAALASLLPAWRAARVDPVVALREE